jgi:hypothetical protein
MTPEAVKFFQAAHRDHRGRRLRVDGDLGPVTQWSIDFESLCEQRQRIIALAQVHLGLTEEPPGSNDDPGGLIRGWLARAGAVPGDPWCAAFTSHCLSAGTPALVRQAGAVSLGRLFPPTAEPLPGDVFWYPVGSSGHGHVGLVLGVAPREVMTLEGNCENAVRCVRRSRFPLGSVISALRFSRTVEDTSGKVPGVIPSVPPAPGSAGATR